MPDLSFRLRRFTAAAVVVAAIGAVAACDSTDDKAVSISRGGTLRAVISTMPTHLDPQNISAALDANISRLISRTLTTYKAEAGSAGSELVPDLATDLGRPSENNKVWEFKLREGVKWEDSTAINCSQLKYGIERNFSTLFKEGLPYARLMLQNNAAAYQGPYVDGNNQGKGLESVTCTDSRTIQFRLKQPVGDFNYTVALSVFAPVKQGADSDKKAYDKQPLSDGPYRVEPRTDDKTMTLVRNEHWDPSVDEIRKAFPDKIILVADGNDPAMTNALIQNQGQNQNTIMLNKNVAPNFLQQVINDPGLSARTTTGPSGSVRYFAVNTIRISDVRCRQAIAYAFNKRKYRQAMGGSAIGDLATSMVPPNLAAHLNFDHYGTLSKGDGDPDKAAALIDEAKKAGVSCPATLAVAVPDNDTIVRYVKTLVDAYLRIGVRVEIKKVSEEAYWTEITDSGHSWDLIYAGWLPDWANGSGVIPPLFDGRTVQAPGEKGTNNYSFLKSTDIDKSIDEASAEFDLERQYRLWGELDSKLQEMAVTIPVLYPKAVRIMGSNVSGAFIHSQFGMPDLASLGLIDPNIPVDVTSSGS